jgi:hypothetical protein
MRTQVQSREYAVLFFGTRGRICLTSGRDVLWLLFLPRVLILPGQASQTHDLEGFQSWCYKKKTMLVLDLEQESCVMFVLRLVRPRVSLAQLLQTAGYLFSSRAALNMQCL